jgi:hypothetical protein
LFVSGTETPDNTSKVLQALSAHVAAARVEMIRNDLQLWLMLRSFARTTLLATVQFIILGSSIRVRRGSVNAAFS